jgi:TorA maturation chaperone TorD
MPEAISNAKDPLRSEDDILRSQQYGFLARMLGAAPSADLIEKVAEMEGDGTPLGQAYGHLARKAANTSPAAVEREYFDLFIGVGRGELLPYASFYLTGFLNERPLADLRGDLAVIGVVRVENRHEPEDHIAFLFDVMSGLAAGRFDDDQLNEHLFYQRHLAPWAAQFFDDLAIATSADFYRPLAEIGRVFMDIEARAFALGSAGERRAGRTG